MTLCFANGPSALQERDTTKTASEKAFANELFCLVVALCLLLSNFFPSEEGSLVEKISRKRHTHIFGVHSC